MDYNEIISAKSKENLEGILENFKDILGIIEAKSRYRYEFLIKILIEKRIIDTDSEVLKFIQNEHLRDAKELVDNLPYLDINDHFPEIPVFEQNFKKYINFIDTAWEYEVQSLLERLERLEEKTDFLREKEE